MNYLVNHYHNAGRVVAAFSLIMFAKLQELAQDLKTAAYVWAIRGFLFGGTTFNIILLFELFHI